MAGRVRGFYSIPTIATLGLELVKEESLDLVLLKPDFPDKPLIEVIRELREFSDVPLVVLNHQTNDLEPVPALEAGAQSEPVFIFSRWCLLTNRWRATNAHNPSITVMGYTSSRPLYKEVMPEPTAKMSTNHLERSSVQ